MSEVTITKRGNMTGAHAIKLRNHVLVHKSLNNVTNRQVRNCRIGKVVLKADAPINH